MKPALVMIAFLLFLGCDNDRTKNDNDKNDNGKKDNTEQKDNTVVVKEPDVYIAWREDANGTVYLTDSDQDIDRLIVDLRPLGVDVVMLEPKYWREEACRKMSARKCAVGDCVIGNCGNAVVGGWNVCRCQ